MKAKVWCLVSLSLVFLGLSPVTPSQAASWQEQMLLSLNSIRAERNLALLTLCQPLTTASQKYANTLARQNFLAHEGKDGSTPGSRIQKAGYDWMNSKKGSMIAENIAVGQNSVAEVMREWSKSKSGSKPEKSTIALNS